MPQLQSPEIQAFANGFPIALRHIAVTVAILFIGVTVYVLMTPHREIALIREGNSAAALSLGGVLVGLAFIPTLWLAWVFMFIFGFSYGTYQTIYFALAMNITETAIAASMFAILMSITNIGQAVGMGVTGFAVMPDALGYRTTLLVFAACNFLLLPLMRPAFRSSQKA